MCMSDMDECNRNVDKAAVPSDKLVAATTPTNGLAGTKVGALQGPTSGDKLDEDTTPPPEIEETVLPAKALIKTTPPDGLAGTKDAPPRFAPSGSNVWRLAP
jgi:hypothetical protein